MQKIPLQLARPDMVLAKPVTRENGMVLIAAGTALTEALISRLGNMDVEQVVGEGDHLDAGGDGAKALARKRERLDHQFRGFTQDKYMQRVKHMVMEYHAQRCALAAVRPSDEEER